MTEKLWLSLCQVFLTKDLITLFRTLDIVNTFHFGDLSAYIICCWREPWICAGEGSFVQLEVTRSKLNYKRNKRWRTFYENSLDVKRSTYPWQLSQSLCRYTVMQRSLSNRYYPMNTTMFTPWFPHKGCHVIIPVSIPQYKKDCCSFHFFVSLL